MTRDSHPVAALGAARILPKRLNEGLRLRWKSVGFFKNRTEIPRRFASRNDKIFAFIPYAGGAQLGQSEAYRGDPTRCLACGEKDRDWENCHSGRAFGKVRVLLVIFVIGGGFSLNFTPVARW